MVLRRITGVLRIVTVPEESLPTETQIRQDEV